jgi:uncharacterized protein (DUF488 family)
MASRKKRDATSAKRRHEAGSMTTLHTIGYEGCSIEDFVSTLAHAGIDTLIDIRDVPISRKRGFSKRSFTQSLAERGITYVHLRELGDPKPGRDAARRGDIQGFQRIFRSHLEGEDAQDGLTSAVEIAFGSPSCLLCFEREPACCHRSIVAEAMSARADIQIRHLEVRRGISAELSRAAAENEIACEVG